jgi:hypothetical protein
MLDADAIEFLPVSIEAPHGRKLKICRAHDLHDP